MGKEPKPTRAEIEQAKSKTVPDILAPNLKVLFCGINPGLYSGATGHHFARPGNRFWPALHLSGFTPRRLQASDEQELLHYGLGITNIVARATAAAAELSPQEMLEGGQRLREKVALYRPGCLAVLGIGAYRLVFNSKAATVGPQPESLGETILWVLPNPSGLNAHYRLEDLARLFAELRETLEAGERP